MEYIEMWAFVIVAIIFCFLFWLIAKSLQKRDENEEGPTKYPWLDTRFTQQKKYPTKQLSEPGIKIARGSYPNASWESKPKNCHFCQTKLHSLNRYLCSMCSNYFCVEHRNHASHQGVYSPETSSPKFSIIDKCVVCKKGLTTFSKVSCVICFKSFCKKHVQPDKHDCKALHTGPYQRTGYEYPDGTRVYFTNSKAGPGYKYGKKK